MNKSSDDSEYTVEFLNHLRLIHFSIIGVCFMVLIAAVMSPPYIVKNAYEEARDIRVSTTEPTEPTEPYEWLRNKLSLTEQIKDLSDANPIVILINSSVYKIDMRWPFNVSPGDLSRIEPNTVSIFREIDENYSEPGIAYDTLQDFKKFWNYLHKWNDAFFIDEWNRNKINIVTEPELSKDVKIVNKTPSNILTEPYMLHSKSVLLKYTQESNWELIFEFNESAHGIKQPIERMSIPIQLKRKNVQKLYKEDISLDWPNGDFSDSFRNLSKYSTNIDTLEIKDLEKRLYELLSEAGPVIQIFGTGVPVTLLRMFGPIVIASMQLYFLLHLRRFNRIPVNNEAITLHPWVGIYEDDPSKLLVLFTLIILPVYASISIAAAIDSSFIKLFNFSDALIFTAIITTVIVAYFTYQEFRQCKYIRSID